MDTVVLPHFHSHPLHIALFTAVENASFLREQLLQGNPAFEYAFLDASVLISRRHVLAACVRAINDLENKRLKTRNVHSEVVFALSANNNISESFRRFGLSDQSRNIVAIKVGGDKSAVEAHLLENVKGELQPMNDTSLATLRDTAKIRKYYRLDVPKGELAHHLSRDAELFALSSIALKGS